MAITIDTTLVGAGSVNGANSNVLSGFSTGGLSRLVLVESDESQDASTVSSVTASGLTFTKVASINKGTAQGNVEIWAAWAAAQQTNVAITINYTGASFPQGAGRTECWSGTADGSADITKCFGATATAAFTATNNPTATIITTRGGSQVVAAVGDDGSTSLTAGSNQTNEGTTSSVGGVSQLSCLYQNSNTSLINTSVTMNATLTVAPANAIVVIEILQQASNKPGNMLKYFIVGNGLSRGEVAN